jgi:hypothetical protein
MQTRQPTAPDPRAPTGPVRCSCGCAVRLEGGAVNAGATRSGSTDRLRPATSTGLHPPAAANGTSRDCVDGGQEPKRHSALLDRYHGYNLTVMPGRHQAATRGDLEVEHVRGTSPDGGVGSTKSSYAVMPCTLAVRRGIDVRHPVEPPTSRPAPRCGSQSRRRLDVGLASRTGSSAGGRSGFRAALGWNADAGRCGRVGRARTRAADSSVRVHAAQQGRSRSALRGSHVP